MQTFFCEGNYFLHRNFKMRKKGRQIVIATHHGMEAKGVPFRLEISLLQTVGEKKGYQTCPRFGKEK